MFETIKKNLIDNFLLKNYRYHCVRNQQAIFDYIAERFPFPFTVEHNKSISTMTVNMGDNVIFDIDFTWEFRENNTYKLVNIS